MAPHYSRDSAAPASEPELTVPPDRLATALSDRIAKGGQLAIRPVSTKNDVEKLRNDYYSWDEYNITLIRRSFSTSQPADQYHQLVLFAPSPATLEADYKYAVEDIMSSVRRLKSLLERLPLFYVQGPLKESQRPAPSADAQDVFVVHGHDDATRNAVSRFIQQITGREPVILHEQPNSGLTVIEKFEQHARSTGFAVILLTGDDEGKTLGTETLALRARQNVVLELGFFVSALGRQRVAALHEAGVELPSDISGMLYTSLESDWKMELAREMRAAGLDVDLNMAL